MSAAALKMANPGAAELIADIAEKLVRKE